MNRYELRPKGVSAIKWTGENRAEVDFFLRGILMPNEGPYFSADEESGEKYDDYNTVQFYYGDDIEVDPGHWIVFPDDTSMWDIRIMTDRNFQGEYRPEGSDE